MQLRRHLAVIEELFFTPLKKREDAKTAVGDIKTLHKELRKSLSALDRPDKRSHEWTAEFRNTPERFDVIAKRHPALAAQCEAAAHDAADNYETAKVRRRQGSPWSRKKV